MASPHVAGGAALLRERHPTWTVAQIKSALVLTGDAAYADGSRATEAAATREGGGVIDLPRANGPKIFATPTDLSFGFLRPGGRATRTVSLADAGDGGGAWSASVALQSAAQGVTVTVPASVSVPGRFTVAASAASSAAEHDVTGFVLLTRGTDSRRIPFWLRVTAPKLGGERRTVLKGPGVYRGDTRRGVARPPSVRRVARSQAALTLAGTDRGSGVDPSSVVAKIDAQRVARVGYSRQDGRLQVPLAGVAPGKHTLTLQISDFEESKNMEDVARILPNTRTFRAAFTVR